MAHYAFINENGIVVEVITGRDEDDTTGGITDWEAYYASQREGLICKRTSYNTFYEIETLYDETNPEVRIGSRFTGRSLHRNGKTPFRGKCAGIGDIYDAVNDVFITPVTEATRE